MLQYQVRVKAEKEELDIKLASLVRFIESPAFGGVAEAEQGRLKTQRALMADYSLVLAERMAAWVPA